MYTCGARAPRRCLRPNMGRAPVAAALAYSNYYYHSNIVVIIQATIITMVITMITSSMSIARLE